MVAHLQVVARAESTRQHVFQTPHERAIVARVCVRLQVTRVLTCICMLMSMKWHPICASEALLHSCLHRHCQQKLGVGGASHYTDDLCHDLKGPDS